MSMHPLGRLITERMEHPDHRWSVRDVERRARERGESLSKTTVAALRREMTPQISRVTVNALAAGLGVTPLTVANAALESWGISTHPAEVTDSLATIAIDPSLSERDRRQLRTLITEMRDTAKDDHDLETAAQSDASTQERQAQEAKLRRRDELKDDRGVAIPWTNPKLEPGVVGRPGDDRRHQGGSG